LPPKPSVFKILTTARQPSATFLAAVDFGERYDLY
jgi:hypothetical protein